MADAAVIGVPHEQMGRDGQGHRGSLERCATEDADALAADIIAATRGRLAHYKCPTSIDFVESLPRNPSGKVLKRELRQPYWAGRDRNIH